MLLVFEDDEDLLLFAVFAQALIGGHSNICRSFFERLASACLISSGRFSNLENFFLTFSIEFTFNGSAFGFGQYFYND